MPMFKNDKGDSGTSNITVASEEVITLHHKVEGKEYPQARDFGTEHDDFYGDPYATRADFEGK
jgi:hypothetical protein